MKIISEEPGRVAGSTVYVVGFAAGGFQHIVQKYADGTLTCHGMSHKCDRPERCIEIVRAGVHADSNSFGKARQ